MSLLGRVKKSMGIASTITTMDDDLQFWIDEAKTTMQRTAGIPQDVLTEGMEDPRAVAAIVFYVLAFHGLDRFYTTQYYSMYKHKLRELQTEDGGVWDTEAGDA